MSLHFDDDAAAAGTMLALRTPYQAYLHHGHDCQS
jgi:hypothetical protein